MPRISLLFLVLFLTAIQAVFSFPIDTELEKRGAPVLKPISQILEQRLKTEVPNPTEQENIQNRCAQSWLCFFDWDGCMEHCVSKKLAKLEKIHETSGGK